MDGAAGSTAPPISRILQAPLHAKVEGHFALFEDLDTAPYGPGALRFLHERYGNPVDIEYWRARHPPTIPSTAPNCSTGCSSTP